MEPSTRLSFEPSWSDGLLRDVLDAAPDATIGVDPAGRIVIANARALDLFGYGREELIGQSVEVLLPERLRGRHSNEREEFVTGEGHRAMGDRAGLRARRKNGSEFSADVSLSVVHTQAGPLTIAAVRDITDRIDAEANARVLEEIVRVKGDLLRVFSHELFTPITKIQAMAGTLLHVDAAHIEPTELRALFDGVAKASGRLRRLMRHIDVAASLDLGTPAVSVSSHPIGAVIEGALEDAELKSFKGRVRVSADRSDFDRAVAVDAQLLELAVVLILENALEFGGNEPIDVSLAVVGEEVQVRISDMGPGIPEHERARATGLFTQIDSNDTRSHGGVGLGLALAAKIAELHGGRMTIGDREPHGTVVVLALPVAPPR